MQNSEAGGPPGPVMRPESITVSPAWECELLIAGEQYTELLVPPADRAITGRVCWVGDGEGAGGQCVGVTWALTPLPHHLPQPPMCRPILAL